MGITLEDIDAELARRDSGGGISIADIDAELARRDAADRESRDASSYYGDYGGTAANVAGSLLKGFGKGAFGLADLASLGGSKLFGLPQTNLSDRFSRGFSQLRFPEVQNDIGRNALEMAGGMLSPLPIKGYGLAKTGGQLAKDLALGSAAGAAGGLVDEVAPNSPIAKTIAELGVLSLPAASRGLSLGSEKVFGPVTQNAANREVREGLRARGVSSVPEISGLTTAEALGSNVPDLAAVEAETLMKNKELASKLATENQAALKAELEGADPQSLLSAQAVRENLSGQLKNLEDQRAAAIEATRQGAADSGLDIGSLGSPQERGAAMRGPLLPREAELLGQVNKAKAAIGNERTLSMDEVSSMAQRVDAALKKGRGNLPSRDFDKIHKSFLADMSNTKTVDNMFARIGEYKAMAKKAPSEQARKVYEAMAQAVKDSMPTESRVAEEARAGLVRDVAGPAVLDNSVGALLERKQFQDPAMKKRAPEFNIEDAAVEKKILSSPASVKQYKKAIGDETKANALLNGSVLSKIIRNGEVDLSKWGRERASLEKSGALFELDPKFVAMLDNNAKTFEGAAKSIEDFSTGARSTFLKSDRDLSGSVSGLLAKDPEYVKEFVAGLNDSGREGLAQATHDWATKTGLGAVEKELQGVGVSTKLSNQIAKDSVRKNLETILGKDRADIVASVAVKVKAKANTAKTGTAGAKEGAQTAMFLGSAGKPFLAKGTVRKTWDNADPATRRVAMIGLGLLVGGARKAVGIPILGLGLGVAARRTLSKDALTKSLEKMLTPAGANEILKHTPTARSELVSALKDGARVLSKGGLQVDKSLLSSSSISTEEGPRVRAQDSADRKSGVVAKSTGERVPAHIINRMIQQESGGNPNAVSSKKAQGLMQLMPKTGRELAKKEGVSYKPFDAAQNKKLGTRYINELFHKYRSIDLAVAAYNWGMGNLDKYLETGKGRVPSETRQYVKSITGKDLSV